MSVLKPNMNVELNRTNIHERVKLHNYKAELYQLLLVV